MSIRRVYSRNTLQARERMKLRKEIEMLFRQGEAFSFFPIRVVFYLENKKGNSDSPVKVGFSVPKKRFKRAVWRNRNKRLMRESWRTQKKELYQVIPPDKQLYCFLIMVGGEMLTFEIAKKTIGRILAELTKKISLRARPNKKI